MKSIRDLSFKITTLSTLFLLPFSAFAGSNPTMVINTTASAQGIPTLSGTMLVVLSLLLFAVAARITKQKKSGINKMFITLLSVGLISLTTGGIQVISKANAALHGPLIVDPLGSTLGQSTINLNTGNMYVGEPIDDVIGYNVYTNQTPGVVVEIIDIIDGQNCGDTPLNTIFSDEYNDPNNPDINNTTRTEVPDYQTCAEGVRLGTGASCDITCIDPQAL